MNCPCFFYDFLTLIGWRNPNSLTSLYKIENTRIRDRPYRWSLMHWSLWHFQCPFRSQLPLWSNTHSKMDHLITHWMTTEQDRHPQNSLPCSRKMKGEDVVTRPNSVQPLGSTQGQSVCHHIYAPTCMFRSNVFSIHIRSMKVSKFSLEETPVHNIIN